MGGQRMCKRAVGSGHCGPYGVCSEAVEVVGGIWARIKKNHQRNPPDDQRMCRIPLILVCHRVGDIEAEPRPQAAAAAAGLQHACVLYAFDRDQRRVGAAEQAESDMRRAIRAWQRGRPDACKGVKPTCFLRIPKVAPLLREANSIACSAPSIACLSRVMGSRCRAHT